LIPADYPKRNLKSSRAKFYYQNARISVSIVANRILARYKGIVLPGSAQCSIVFEKRPSKCDSSGPGLQPSAVQINEFIVGHALVPLGLAIPKMFYQNQAVSRFRNRHEF
jgi:hypothetical protein